ncbi:hypothetical protein HDU93_006305, partial [Gonapodya sp. JEL0774]
RQCPIRARPFSMGPWYLLLPESIPSHRETACSLLDNGSQGRVFRRHGLFLSPATNLKQKIPRQKLHPSTPETITLFRRGSLLLL